MGNPSEKRPSFVFWNSIKRFAWTDFKSCYKRYLLINIYAFFTFLISLSCLLPAYFYREESVIVTIFSIILSIILFVFLVVPAFRSFIIIIITDLLLTEQEDKLPSFKLMMSRYFDFHFVYIRKMFTGFARSGPIFLIAILTFLVTFFGSIIPSHFIKIAAEPQYFSLFNEAIGYFKIDQIETGIIKIFALESFYKIEILASFGITIIVLFISLLFKNFQTFLLHSNQLTPFNVKGMKKIYKITVNRNKWGFAAFFIKCYDLPLSLFLILFVGAMVSFYFILESTILILVISLLISSTAIYALFLYISFINMELMENFLPIFFHSVQEVSLDIHLYHINKKKLKDIPSLFKGKNETYNKLLKTLQDSVISIRVFYEMYKELKSLKPDQKQVEELTPEEKISFLIDTHLEETYKKFNEIFENSEEV